MGTNNNINDYNNGSDSSLIKIFKGLASWFPSPLGSNSRYLSFFLFPLLIINNFLILLQFHLLGLLFHKIRHLAF